MFQGRRIVTLLISILASVLLWLYVVTNITPEATKPVGSIPIVVDGADTLRDRGLVITSQNPGYLSLDLKASRADLSKLTSKTILVSADASKIKEAGTHQLSCEVTFPDTVRGGDVDIQRKSVEYVTVSVTQLEKRSFPIQLVSIGSVKEGFLLEAASAVLNPAEVVVTGPEEEVSKIDKVIVEYDVSDLEDTETVTAPIRFLDKDKEEVSFSDLVETGNTEIELTLPVVRRRELTLGVSFIEGGGIKTENASVQLMPPSIVVTGPANVIDDLPDPYPLGEVNLEDMSSYYEVKTFLLNLPAGVTNKSGVTEVNAVIRLSGVKTDTISVSDIRILNKPNGYLTELSTQAVTLNVRGGEEEINQIKESNDNGIYVEVDLKDHLQTGAFTVKGVVYNPLHPNVSVQATVEGIAVKIYQPDQPFEPDNE